MLFFWLLWFQEWCHSCRARYFLGRLFSVPIDVTRFGFTHGGQVTTIVIFLRTNICVLFPHFSANERAHNFLDIRFLLPNVPYRTIPHTLLYYLGTSASCNEAGENFCVSLSFYCCTVSQVLFSPFIFFRRPLFLSITTSWHSATQFLYWSWLANADSDNCGRFVAALENLTPWNFYAFENRTNFNSGLHLSLFAFTVTCLCYHDMSE